MASHDHLLKDKIGLVEIENEIELTHVSEISVKHLHEVMNNIKNYQFVIFFFDASHEVQRSISAG